MEFIGEFFQQIWDFVLQIPDMFNSFLQVIGAHLIIAFTKAKLAGIAFAWGIAKEIMIQLNLSGTINSLWGSIDSTLMGYITFFKIPEALAMILNARVTRYVIDVMGF